MKTYLVTYYFVNSEVHAVRYVIDTSIFKNKIDFSTYLEENKYISNTQEIVNMDNVCRFTIDEIERKE